MEPFPDMFEFLEFFGVEPKVLHDDSPAYYNHWQIVYSHNNEKLIIDLEPAYCEFKLEWFQNDLRVGKFNINDVKGLCFEGKKDSALILSFDEQNQADIFKLRLKPQIQIEWGLHREF